VDRSAEDDKRGDGPGRAGAATSDKAGRAAGRWSASALRPHALFLLSWVFLSACMNIRAPLWSFLDPPHSWVLPSPEVTALFALFCLTARLGWRVSRGATAALAVFFVFTRLLRIADGINMRYFRHPFIIVSDGRLLLELPRLLVTAMPMWLLLLLPVLLVAAAVGLGLIVHRNLRHVQAYLTRPAGQALFGGITAVSLVLSWLVPPLPVTKPHQLDHRLGVFGTSVAVRWAQEVDFALHVFGYRDDKVRPIKQATGRLSSTPISLRRLDGANVLLFFIESYGACVQNDPRQAAVVGPAWDRVEKALGEAGYEIRSGQLDSPTYGGGSWLAHATMDIGARIDNQFLHTLLLNQPHVKTMAAVFNEAGYRTVHVAPNTTRAWHGDAFFQYQAQYNLWHFDYKGPMFSWATMADQYVIDFLHRREVSRAAERLFVEYVLVSSHGPFDVQPPVLDDWSRVGDGSIYREIPPVTYPHLNWGNLEHGGAEAYDRSIVYDLDVLTQYLVRFIHDGSLIVWLGDHQPVPEVTKHDPSNAVPVHVISRNKELLAPFERRGYAAGMRPSKAAPRGLETFVHDLVSDFN
jgi:hypothetical protein